MFDKSQVYAERGNYNFLPEVQLMFFISTTILLFYQVTSVQVWGFKSTAIFDIWTIEHIASGMAFSYLAIAYRHKISHPILLTLCLSLGWEAIEHYLETQSYPFLMDWFAGTEHWMNRIFADQLAVVFGFMLVKAFPKTINFARLFSIVFIAIHVYLGNSMFFH